MAKSLKITEEDACRCVVNTPETIPSPASQETRLPPACRYTTCQTLMSPGQIWVRKDIRQNGLPLQYNRKHVVLCNMYLNECWELD